jgi:hypothetical protein
LMQQGTVPPATIQDPGIYTPDYTANLDYTG